jgi:multicomponent K+:H+ antiporter subunit D
VALLQWSDEQAGPSAMGVYLPANWPAPFGIVLALDRLSAMMLVLTYCVALAAAVLRCPLAQGGVHFHPLFQFQLMGLSGAF